MIYATAKTPDDIAKLLRGTYAGIDDLANAALCADRLIGKKSTPGIIITAPRQSGKTTELLRYAEEKYPNAQFAVVCLNDAMQRLVLYTYSTIRGDVSVTPPLIMTPGNITHILLGVSHRAIFCDEWNLLPGEVQENVLKTGLFIAAVTS